MRDRTCHRVVTLSHCLPRKYFKTYIHRISYSLPLWRLDFLQSIQVYSIHVTLILKLKGSHTYSSTSVVTSRYWMLGYRSINSSYNVQRLIHKFYFKYKCINYNNFMNYHAYVVWIYVPIFCVWVVIFLCAESLISTLSN